MSCKNISKKVLSETKWLKLSTIEYLDANGQTRTWDSAERTTSHPPEPDGVDIIAIVHSSKHQDKPKELLLALQYRPPLGQLSLEFPAGLVDAGESASVAAVRELHEETGYFGTFVSASPVLSIDAGMSSSNTMVVNISVDLDDEQNSHPQPSFDVGEFIETFRVPLDGLLNSIILICHQKNATCDAKLYTFALSRMTDFATPSSHN